MWNLDVTIFYDYIVIFGKKIKLNLKVEKQYEIYKKKHLYLFLLQLNYKNFMKIEKEMNWQELKNKMKLQIYKEIF
jgi:hypothetical protein